MTGTKNYLRSHLRMMKDLRNMATLNRRHHTEIARVAADWETQFDKQIRRLTLRLRLR